MYEGIYSEPIKYQFIRDFVLNFYEERAKVKNTDSVLGDLYKLILNNIKHHPNRLIEIEELRTSFKVLDNYKIRIV